MNIAFNINFAEPFYQNGYSYFLSTCIPLLAEKFPEHHFLLIGDKIKIRSDAANISTSAIKNTVNNKTISGLIYNYKLSVWLKKNMVDVFVTIPDKICSKTTVPQVSVVFDDSIMHLSAYKTKKIKSALHISEMIIADTISTAKKITETYKIDTKKVNTMCHILNKKYFQVTAKEKESVKEKSCHGKEYFLFFGETAGNNNLFNLLKAFSVFKKMQKSNMHLVIASPEMEMQKTFTDSLKNYKYREDIVILPDMREDELIRLTASAYAVIHPSKNENTAYYLLNTLNLRVPLIMVKTKRFTEIFGDAVLFSETEKINDLADKMMLVFKDESAGDEVIKKTIQHIRKFNNTATCEAFWNTIVSVPNH